MMHPPLSIGDPVPWFEARTVAGTSHSLSVMAGRWIALFFLRDMSDPVATRVLAEVITRLGRFFNDDHVVFYGVLTSLPPAPVADQLAQASHRGLGFMHDEDGAITRAYQAEGALRLVVIDPLLRIERVMMVGEGGVSADDICAYLGALSAIDDFAGVPLVAPALVIPHVFEPEFCERLVQLYDANGGVDSGFMLDKDGKTQTVINHDYKQRNDFILRDPALRADIRRRIMRRVVPMMGRFFQYAPTRMDRYLVSCYDSVSGGHFSRHRDNINKGAQHRRFAASFNLNEGYEGCQLIFPEFGRRLYAAPRGGAIVFSTGALHQVLPVTKGKRYAFVPFFYGEEDARLRLQNNENLHDGEGLYTGEEDLLDI